jgi:hypothetical protein
MANGGLLQLVAYGAQDVYLTANPQVTFFKQLYRRHSNFAMESIEQTFNGVANFGRRVQCTIARNGDLITRVYLQVTLPEVSGVAAGEYFAWVPYVGQFLIDYVEVEIGGQRIDKHYGDWLHIWNELTLPTGKQLAYLNMVNGYGGIRFSSTVECSACEVEATIELASASACLNPTIAKDGDDCALQFGSVVGLANAGLIPNANNEAAPGPALDASGVYCAPCTFDVSGICLPEQTLYVPLEFWFNRHTGLALPLIALQYHEVKINIEFNELRYLVNVDSLGTATSVLTSLNSQGLAAASLYVDYIYLDTEERRRFAQTAHEYLIEQLQYTGEESVTSTSNKIQMNFNHPCKEIIWVVQNPSYIDCNSLSNQPWRYTDAQLGNPTAVAKIQLNGQDRFSEREGSYFNFVQPYQHHTNTPSTGINVYSFALKPEDLQPSGSCNMSRIDNAVLNLTLTPSTFNTLVQYIDAGLTNSNSTQSQNSANVRIYATNYNVLRIMSGMGGLAYSN